MNPKNRSGFTSLMFTLETVSKKNRLKVRISEIVSYYGNERYKLAG